MKNDIQNLNSLEKKDNSENHVKRSNDEVFIFKRGKWYLETEWIGYEDISTFLKSLGRSKLDGLKLWFEIWNGFETEKVCNDKYKPLYFSLIIEPGKGIPTELVGKRVYVQNNDYYFRNGWYYKKFQKRKNDSSVLNLFQNSFMKKINDDLLQVPSWTSVKIRHAIYQQFYKKFEAFDAIKDKKKLAKSKRKPNLYIGIFELEEAENSWIRVFYEYIRSLKTKEAALINLKNNFTAIFNYFESTRCETTLSDISSSVIADTPSRIDILIPRKSIIKEKSTITTKSDQSKTISSTSAQNAKNTQNSKFKWKNISIKVIPKDLQPPFDLNKDLARTLSELREDIIFLTPNKGSYAPDLFKVLRSFNTQSLACLMNALITSLGYKDVIKTPRLNALRAYHSTLIIDKQLPKSFKRKKFYIFSFKAYRRTGWSYKLSQELFIPIRDLCDVNKKKTYNIIAPTSGRLFKKKIGIQNFLRKSLGIEGSPSIYIPKYEIETIGAAARVLLQEKTYCQIDAPNIIKLNKFFKENPSLFKAKRDPDSLNTNFTFLVAISSQSQNLKEIYKLISNKSIKKANYSKQDDQLYFNLARIQLKNTMVLDGFKWSVNDVKESGVLDLIIGKKNYEIPTDIGEFLKEGGFLDYFLTALFVNKDLRMIINDLSSVKLSITSSYFMTQQHRTPPTKLYEKIPESAGFTLANIPDATSGIVPGIGTTELAMFKVFRHAMNRSISKSLAEPLKCHSCSKQFYLPFQMDVYLRDDLLFLFNREERVSYIWEKKIIDTETHGVIVITIPDLATNKLNRFSEVFASAFVRYRKHGSIKRNEKNKFSEFIEALKEKINSFQPHNPISKNEIKALLNIIHIEAADANEFTRVTLINYLKTIFSAN